VVEVAAGADAVIFLPLLHEHHGPALHALVPEVLGRLPLRQEGDSATDATKPAHSATSSLKLAEISRVARTGFGAPVIGRPITSTEAPPSNASRGVTTLFWSATAAPAGRTPGTTRKPSGQAERAASTSSPEQTMPSMPASCARSASRRTCSFGDPGTPIAVRSAWSRLVRTVTPTTLVPAGAAAFAAAIISRPPAAWTVRIAG